MLFLIKWGSTSWQNLHAVFIVIRFHKQSQYSMLVCLLREWTSHMLDLTSKLKTGSQRLSKFPGQVITFPVRRNLVTVDRWRSKLRHSWLWQLRIKQYRIRLMVTRHDSDLQKLFCIVCNLVPARKILFSCSFDLKLGLSMLVQFGALSL